MVAQPANTSETPGCLNSRLSVCAQGWCTATQVMYDSSRLWNSGASAPVRRATAPPSRRRTSARGWFYRTFIADPQWLLPQPPWPPECWSSAAGTAMKTSATTPPTNRPVATTAPTISCCGRFDAAGADFSCVVGCWMIGRTWEVCPTWE